MEGFLIRGKKLSLNLTLFDSIEKKLPYLNLLGRYYQLDRMLEKRKIVLNDWIEVKKLIESDIDEIKLELTNRILQLRNVNEIKSSFKVIKISIDILKQKNGSKFYRGRIKIPKEHRESFNLKTPRKEFLIKRKEIMILVNRFNKKREEYPKSIINNPKLKISEKNIEDTALGREMQYLIYEKYISFIKTKFNIS
jgi:bifunctional DNA-binding transcriptional regulator/antitoxin component of YhaV-PrlF toxin-antitoxin module